MSEVLAVVLEDSLGSLRPLVSSHNITNSQLIASLRHLKPSTRFKAHWQYNNIPYLLASQLPEQLHGELFHSFVQDHIWNPLGMHHTYYDHVLANRTGDLSSGFARRLPHGYSGFLDIEACRDDIKRSTRLSAKCRGQELDLGWFQTDWRSFAGAGGIITCSRDLVRLEWIPAPNPSSMLTRRAYLCLQIIWLETLLLKGSNPTTGEQIIPSAIIDATITPNIAPRPKATDPETTVPYYGLAQLMYDYRGYRVIEHGGDVPGQRSQVIRLSDKMIGVAIMVNDEHLGGLYREVITWRIIDHLLGLRPVDFKTRSVAVLCLMTWPQTHNARTS